MAGFIEKLIGNTLKRALTYSFEQTFGGQQRSSDSETRTIASHFLSGFACTVSQPYTQVWFGDILQWSSQTTSLFRDDVRDKCRSGVKPLRFNLHRLTGSSLVTLKKKSR